MTTPPNPSSPQPSDPLGPKRNGRAGGGGSEKREPVLRRTTIRPGSGAPDPVDAAFVANRLTTLTHELANLLEGSMRNLLIARRNLEEERSAAAANGGPVSDDLSRRLDTVQTAMEHMSALVKASMGSAEGAAAPRCASRDAEADRKRWASASEAVAHAAEVMRPICDEKRISLDVHIADEARAVTTSDGPGAGSIGHAGGAVYGIALNAVRNAIESIDRVPDHQEGRIVVTVHLEHSRDGRRTAVLTVTDNGEGPPEWLGINIDAVFEHGFSTKTGGHGVGLALARDLVRSLGGAIALRRGTPETELDTPGAVLEVRWPARLLAA